MYSWDSMANFFPEDQDVLKPTRITLSRKILAFYVATSLVIAALSSGLQISLEFLSDREDQQHKIDSFKYMSIPSLENFLWTLNMPAIQEQLKALLSTRDLIKIEILDEAGRVLKSEAKAGSYESRTLHTFDLHNPTHEKERIGSVRLSYTQDYMAANVKRMSFLFIITNLAMTLLGAVILLYLLNKTLLKRFERFNKHVATQDWQDPKPYTPEEYSWPFGHTEDEFTEVEKGYSAASEQIRSVTSRLEAAAHSSSRLAELGTLSAGIAHEINNPLTIIQAYAAKITHLKQKGFSENDVIGFGQAIIKGTHRISQIVRGLRYFSSGRSEQDVEYVLLKELMNEISPFFETTLEQKGVKLKIDFENENLAVVGHSVQLSQVLLNLINNSVDAIQSASEKWIHIQFSKNDDNFIVCTFTDSGNGIAPEVQPNLFVPFYTTKTIGKGTGLGLAIVHGIVRKHGGDIKLNAKSKHTQFIITLPINRGGQSAA